MRMPMNSTVSRVVASIEVWFVVFLILVGGGFTFEGGQWKPMGVLSLAVAAVISALTCSRWSRGGCRTTGQHSERSNAGAES
jgi:hypothetical protein